jgi:hypothetical protein
MTVRKLTPILFAEEIEPCLKFWMEHLGFEKTIDVPDGNKLSFAILQKGPVELMYQTYASAQKDVTTVSRGRPQRPIIPLRRGGEPGQNHQRGKGS